MSFLDKLHPLFRTPGDNEPNIAYFIARRNEEGERWAQEYTRPEHVELMAGTNRALQALRKRRIDEGFGELQAVASLFHQTERTTTPEVHHILGRWYYGLLAYYLYCIEDYRGADEALDRGHEEVRQAIDCERLLLPYAMECHEFWYQRIRIARNQRLWSEVQRRVEITSQIAAGERPCCVLSDGTTIGLPAVQAFYAGFEALTPAERRPLRRILDEEGRHHQLRLARGIYLPPEFVIPYTPAPPA